MSSLSLKLEARQSANNPIRVGLIGCGKFGSMYLSQAHRTPGIHMVAIADLDPSRAITALQRVNWPQTLYSTSVHDQPPIPDALRSGLTTITTDSLALISTPGIDVILECTGSPSAGIAHALSAIQHKKHIIMVNVEADVLAGPHLAHLAAQAGTIYSLAYGDQPALIAEMVDWARTSGFRVVCAGKGTKHLPAYHASTPDTVWDHYGLPASQTADLNPKMFNSFLDGTKSAIEMAAVCNACDLRPQACGLQFPPCSALDLPELLKPKSDGGILDHQPPASGPQGTVEVVSCLNADGSAVPHDLRWGVYVVLAAADGYQRACFAQYGLRTDGGGWYAAQWKPYHLIGLELGVSVANVVLRGEPTGACRTWAADVVATAKRDLGVGEVLDGEGGFTVYGTLVGARESLEMGFLPVGVAGGVKLRKGVGKGERLCWGDVEWDGGSLAVRVRKEMEGEWRERLLEGERGKADA